MMAADAAAAVALFAAAPMGTGLVLRGPPCAARDTILAVLGRHLTLRRLPLHTSWDRLSGGTDLGRSIAAGRVVHQAGVLESPGVVLVLASAERWDRKRAAAVATALDAGQFGLIALDEGIEEESLAPALAERAAFQLRLDALPEDFAPALPDPGWLVANAPIALTEALVTAALALGVTSPRAGLLAERACRLAAGLAGRDEANESDAALAARLVLAHRATQLPEAPEPPAEPPPEAETPKEPPVGETGTLADQVLEAVRMVLPADWLASAGGASRLAGQAAARARARGRGRPAGTRPGLPGNGDKLDLMASLRAAAPWQKLRGRDQSGRVVLKRDDLRIRRMVPRSAAATIFAVDASGSQAVNRLNEAKGAVEALLARCYVRRDTVALIGFRGKEADILLPPTRAPARARTCLAQLPGGGGTPLARGIATAHHLADLAVRRGENPLVVLLTDGQANIAADGTPGRPRAKADALTAARAMQQAGHAALVIDTAPRQDRGTHELAQAMGARHVRLPHADAEALSRAVLAGRR